MAEPASWVRASRHGDLARPVASGGHVMAPALGLTVVPADAQTVPGGRQSVSLVVQNTARTAARCHLDVSGIPDDWYTLDKRRFSLGPGERKHVLLALTPPA